MSDMKQEDRTKIEGKKQKRTKEKLVNYREQENKADRGGGKKFL
jgi:hypothetical protein